MSPRLMLLATGGALLIWAGAAAQQETRPTPGPGSGIMNVAGTVSIGNEPRVQVSNTPDVRIANIPMVVGAPPPFLRINGRYTITWPDGASDDVTVTDAGQGGWAQVQSAGARRKWVNLVTARAIEER